MRAITRMERHTLLFYFTVVAYLHLVALLETGVKKTYSFLIYALHVFDILGFKLYNKIDIFVNWYPVEAVLRGKKDAKCKNINWSPFLACKDFCELFKLTAS